MQTWKLPITRLCSLLKGFSSSAVSLEQCVTEIQRAMLEALAPAAAQMDATIVRRITEAEDVQTLWYLREDLMGALAGCQGEAQATQTLRAISIRFEGLLPGRFSTRPSPLAQS